MEAAISISDLSKSYNRGLVQALRGLNLIVNQGAIHGILGPNGAGKSTTISILCGLLNPDAGVVRVLGSEMPSQLAKVKPRIGVVPQDIALFPSLTVIENLNFIGAMYELKGKKLKDKIDELIHQVNLNAAANRKIEDFSGGMKRRANLIAALLHDPELIFLDEPTVGIDVQSKLLIADLLTKIHQKGTTIVYTSHDLPEAEKLCTELTIVDHGLAVANGNPSDLIASQKGCADLHDYFVAITGKEIRD